MQKLDQRFVEQKVDSIFRKLGAVVVPIDLVSLARIQRVVRIEMRPMLSDGYVEAVQGGFVISIKGAYLHRFEIADEPSLGALKPRQRFTVAHEIAHTLFYDLSNNPPTPAKRAPEDGTLERLCHHGASCLLMPHRHLIQSVAKMGPIAHASLRKLAKEYRVSCEALMRRLDHVEETKTPDRAVLLAKSSHSKDDAQIRAVVYHPTLLAFLRKPPTYSSLREWCGRLVDDEFWVESIWEQRVKHHSGWLSIRKRPCSAREGTFFMELEVFAVDDPPRDRVLVSHPSP